MFVPHNGTLFVTFWGTGDAHDGAALVMSCLVDGAVCQSGSGLAGWAVRVDHPSENPCSCRKPCGGGFGDGGGGPGDCHDNNLAATWCTRIGRGAHTVDLKLASSSGGVVFYERSHIYIDTTKNKKKGHPLCVPAAVVPGSTILP